MAEALTDEELTALRALLAAAESNENVSTVLDLPDAGTLTAQDILYILQGSGSNRDKKVTLGAIRAFMEALENLSVDGQISIGGHAVLKIEQIGDDSFQLVIDSDMVDLPPVHVNGPIESDGEISLKDGSPLYGDVVGNVTGNVDGNVNGDVTGNVNGNVTGNTTGVHYGNVHSDNILPMTSGGNVGITRPNVNGKTTFNNECVYPKILLTSGTYSSELLDNMVYTTMSEGSIVYALNGYNGNSGIQVSSTNIVIVKPGTGVALMKSSSGKWYPLSPDVTLANI